MSKTTLLFLTAIALGTAGAQGAELILRAECRPAGSLVLLGDIAEIHAQDEAEAKKLAAVELCPQPGAGQRRYLRLREILEILELRSLDLAEVRLSGANLTTIHGPALVAPRTPAPLAKENNSTAPPEKPQAVVLAVAAVRPVERGQVIQASDVQLVAFPGPSARDNLLHDVALAVGQEAARSFAPGQPLDPQSLRRPILVRRRDGVRVSVLAPGVRLTADGIAVEEGAYGDWVLIETSYSKDKVRARVCGVKQVEVYVGGVETPPP